MAVSNIEMLRWEMSKTYFRFCTISRSRIKNVKFLTLIMRTPLCKFYFFHLSIMLFGPLQWLSNNAGEHEFMDQVLLFLEQTRPNQILRCKFLLQLFTEIVLLIKQFVVKNWCTSLSLFYKYKAWKILCTNYLLCYILALFRSDVCGK